MRTIRIAVVAAGLSLGLAGCTSNGSLNGSAAPSASTGSSNGASTGASGGPSTGASAGASAGAQAAGVANPCVVGNWRSTGVNATFDAGGASGSASGGGGLMLTVAGNGVTVVDFGGMQPVTFTTTAGGTEIKGRFAYGGKVSGAVAVPSTATTTGVWKPVGTTNWSALTVTVDMISPVNGRVFDRAKIGDFASAGGGQTGGAVDVQPILREAAYECSASILKLGPPPGAAGGTWILQRA